MPIKALDPPAPRAGHRTLKRPLEIAAFAGGSVGLLAASFFGFTLASGAPMSEVALIGGLFEEGEESEPTGEEAPAPGEDASPTGPTPTSSPASDERLLASHRGALAAFPFSPVLSSDDLERLASELEGGRDGLREREEELRRREAELETRVSQFDELEAGIEEIRSQLDVLRETLESERAAMEEDMARREEVLAKDRADLEAREADLEGHVQRRIREIEIENDLEAARKRASLAQTAALFADGDLSEHAKRLLQFSPNDAAHILAAMKKARAAELLAELPLEAWKDYQDAFTALGQ